MHPLLQRDVSVARACWTRIFSLGCRLNRRFGGIRRRFVVSGSFFVFKHSVCFRLGGRSNFRTRVRSRFSSGLAFGNSFSAFGAFRNLFCRFGGRCASPPLS